MEEKIKKLEARLNALSRSREAIVGRLAVEEENKKKTVAELSALGVDVQSMSIKELAAHQEQMKTKLETMVEELSTKLDEAEALVAKFKEL